MEPQAVRSRADQLATRLASAFNGGGAASGQPWLWRPLLQLLATGAPVTVEALAQATGRTTDDIRQALAAMPDTEYDDTGAIVGSGLTQRPTPHRFEVDGQQLYTWCALDTLVFPTVLDRPARVESPCRATGQPIRVQVDPERVVAVEPATAVVSIVTPDDLTSVRSAFCNQVHFFASAEAAADWLDQHPDGTVLPVADAYQLGRPLTQTLQRPPHTDCCG